MSTIGQMSPIDFRDVIFEWQIPRFITTMIGDMRTAKSSPSFTFCGGEWFLQIAYNEDVSHCVELYLALKSSAARKVVDFAVYLKKDDGARFNEWAANDRIFELPDDRHGNTEFARMAQLLEERDSIMHQGTVTVVCHVRESTKANDLMSWNTESDDALVSDLRQLYESKEECDLCLEVQDTKFLVHSAILTARSSVFHFMLQQKDSDNLTITDCHPDSFEDFLQFLYTGRTGQMSFERAHQLYLTADRYCVEKLKPFCISSMARDLNWENVCSGLAFAERYKERGLVSTCQALLDVKCSHSFNDVKWSEASE